MFVYVLGALFLLISLPLLMGKGSWLIAGYNTATKEEKVICFARVKSKW